MLKFSFYNTFKKIFLKYIIGLIMAKLVNNFKNIKWKCVVKVISMYLIQPIEQYVLNVQATYPEASVVAQITSTSQNPS